MRPISPARMIAPRHASHAGVSERSSCKGPGPSDAAQLAGFDALPNKKKGGIAPALNTRP
jgi:hypothetical protein